MKLFRRTQPEGAEPMTDTQPETPAEDQQPETPAEDQQPETPAEDQQPETRAEESEPTDPNDPANYSSIEEFNNRPNPEDGSAVFRSATGYNPPEES